ncbi:MAG: hypothetical protein M1838_002245 [Thelocarpon superellum]|nr:MAG: hypothetical protein M1838_002245 [Thelocarpon superellum]
MVTSPTKRLPPLPSGRPPRSRRISPEISPTRNPSGSSSHPGGSHEPARTPPVRSPARGRSLDEGTPLATKPGESGGRDSHDLSLSPRGRGRESLVDHMLLSLDQFAIEQSSGTRPRAGSGPDLLHDSSPRFSIEEMPRPPATAHGRARGHTYSSSYSSDFDPRAHDLSSRYSTNLSRGRRSNSSSNFQVVLERIDSLRAEEKTRGKLSDAQRTISHGQRRVSQPRGHGVQHSVDSGTSTLEQTNRTPLASPRWTSVSDLRASSLEYVQRGRPPLDPESPLFPSIVPDSPGLVGDGFGAYDAAPTPNVPRGPRGQHSPVRESMPPTNPTCPAPEIPAKDERRGAKLPRSLYATSPRVESFPTSPSLTPRHGSMVMASTAAAPAPSIAFQKSPPFPTTPSTPPAKDRPGFFRRVFGASRHHNHNHTPSPSPAESSQPSSAEAVRSRAPSRDGHAARSKLNHIADQMKTAPVTAAIDAPAVPPKDHPPALNKKASSFFRRRKKSFSEGPPTPVVPIHVPAPQHAAPVEPVLSPTSSLRRVMHPYLRSPPSTQDKFHESRDLPAGQQDANHAEVRAFAGITDRDATAPHMTPPVVTDPSVSPRQEEANMPTLAPTNGDAGLPSTAPPTALPRAPSMEAPPVPNVAKTDVDDVALNPSPPPTEDASTESRDQVTSVAAAINEASDVEMNGSVDKEQAPTPVEPPVALADVPSQEDAPDLPMEEVAAEPTPSAPPQADGADEAVESGPTASCTTEDVKPRDEGDESDLPRQPPPESAARPSATEANAQVENLPPTGHRPVVAAPPVAVEVVATDEWEPAAEDWEKVKKIFDGGEEFISKATAAAWLGESGPASARARKAYMELFDWSNMSILAAMRGLCDKLILKGETQQVDRILDAVASRWGQCNPNHGFKAGDVVHTICYSILLLNTDLYLADIESKMTRSQYVRNTLPTIRRVAAEAAPETFDPHRASIVSPLSHTPSTTEPNSPGLPPTPAPDGKDGAPLTDPSRRSRRRSASEDVGISAPTPLDMDSSSEECGPLVKAVCHGSSRTWEAQVEVVLKNIYNSIKAQRLPLHGASGEVVPEPACPPSHLSVLTGNMLRRSPSTLSRAASESPSLRGRSDVSRTATGRWSSKTRSRPRLYPRSTVGSSRTSFEDEASIWSPTGSSTWSRYSLGKTQTSMSVDSFGSSLPHGDYQQSIGFANALSRAIIREEASETSTSTTTHERATPLLEDETLGLVGAPWAKEAILKHKHHLESVDKKAKDRNWNDCFAVIENGWMRLFSFAAKSSLRSRIKARQASGGVVGGGNWSENAEALGSYLLRQTIASALPPPGYSKARPHVWALSLPTGAVHLFQVGTPEIVKEFVSTANYWSARLSKEPLVGGISNVEYGWGDLVINSALIGGEHSATRPSSGRRPSLQSSIRSSMDQGGSMRTKLPADRIMISDWSPPQQSMMASQLLEVDQLNALLTYVKNIEAELQKHNELRSPMLLAFSPRHPNSTKAMANWERKSSYLLREIVKFRTYIDCLTMAQGQKERVYAERAEHAARLKTEQPQPGSPTDVPAAPAAQAVQAVH